MKKILLIMLSAFALQHLTAQSAPDRTKKPPAGPPPVITIKDPVIYNMSNGMTVLVVENHKLPKVNASLIIDAGPIKEGSKAGVLDLMGGMLGEGTKTMGKAQFDEAIDLIGADVNLSAGGGSAAALTRYFEKAFSYMADGLKNPLFTQDALDKLKQQTLTGLKSSEKSTTAIAGRVLNALYYGKTTAMGEFTTEATVKSITMADVQDAYKNYITPSRSYLTFVGDITPAAAKALTDKYFGAWTGKKLSLPVIADVANPGKTEIDFVDVPTAVQAEMSVGNLVSNPMNSSDYHALLLANYILGGGGDSKLFLNLREKHGFTYGSYSSVGSGRFQSIFKTSAAVRTDKADSAVAEMVHEILEMRDGKITQEELANAKAIYNGSFALGMEDPARSARYASNILINGLPKDFYRTYLQKINALTVEDIKRVSKNYFNEGGSRILIVGNSSKILPSLLRLGYPVKRYDKFAEPITDSVKIVNTAETPKTTDKISAYSIVEDYLKAIGGKEEARKVTSINEDLSMDIMGRSFTGSDKRMNPGKSVTEIKVDTTTVMKFSFNGTTGYQLMQGQKKDLTMGEIKEAADDKAVIPQLYYATADYKLEYVGAGTVEKEPTYRLKVTMPSGRVSVQQYSSKTGFLLEEETTAKEGEEDSPVTISYSDYKKAGNILFPFSITRVSGQQQFPIKVISIKVNEGVTEEDFK